ncbi:BTAD domain-containing putative transcriptional regulator [Saccharopolyspora sp. WRP15-2]|uniref:BTAD domain-containing putative transcriptional regulator n=1 Tax=Saccharopolyspora oryzae TaxID=2997343 RepID=A0ABT4V3J7_9PSEU|nr:BTAD domain-containing putative transcriptional regulator [Saccharopolyspora oryzae]MDA3628530.1 BTAD domain-containing putative transcriptional regulator [Saccharopolyspora oryzae]
MAPYDRPSGAPATGFEFRVLGPLEVLVDGVARPMGSVQVRALLTCLLLEPNQIVSMDRLIDTIWEHDPPATARTIIQGYVSRLRKLFGAGGPDGPEIVTRPPGYLLSVDAERIDAHRARALINRAHGLDPAERSRVLGEALSLWRGPVLTDITSSRLYRMVAPNLDELRLLALEERVDADLDLGRHHQLVLELSTLVDRYPLRERLTGQLMLASYRAGHRAEAQSKFHELRRRLSDELGLDPGPDLRNLYEQVLRDDPALRSPQHRSEPALGIKRPTPAELPPAPAGFVGRRHELGELDRLLAERERGSSLLAVLTGIAGVGKSALALTWAHRVEQEFPDGQLYASLRGYDSEREPLSPGEALTSMLKALGVAAEAIPVELDDRAALYRSLLAKRRVLVLLDNARDSEQVRPLLPGSAESMVLVTSRRRLDGLVVRSGARVLPLETLPTEAAIELLDRARVPGKSASEPAAAAELAALCGGLPLALRIAAARLAANPARGVSDLVHELTDERNRLRALDIDDDADTSVRRAFDISYRSLHPVHAETFRLLGLVPGHTFTADAVAALCDTDPPSAQRRLRTLALAHLVVEPEPDRFAMHDLLRVYARDLLVECDDTGALRRLLNHYLAVADHARRFLRPTRDELNFVSALRPPAIADRAQALDWFDAEWPNLIAAVRAAKARGMHDLAWQLARLQFNYLMVRCPWEDWIRVYTDGLESARAAADPTGEVLMSAGLGVAHSRSGQLDEALAHYDESYRVAVANDDASRRAMTQINMASVLFRLKRYDEAKVHCQDALRVYRSLGDTYFEAGALNNLAMVEQINGELEEALAHLREAEALYRAADDLDTLAMVLNNCGEVCIELGRLDDGERYHHDALDVALKCGSAMRQAAAYLGLGDTARCRGDLAVARTRWETALAIFEAEGSPRVAEARERLDALATPA